MAIEFKSIKVQNLSTKASIYTVPAEVTTFILSFFIANKSSNAAAVSTMFRSGGIDYYINYQVPLPTNSTLQVNDGRKIVLTAGDMIYVESTENVDVIVSIIEN